MQPLDLADLAAPGWLPLLLVGVLAVLVTLLFLSMRKQLRKIDVPVDQQRIASAPFADDEWTPHRG